ncbi:MAG: type II secretion system protein [Planctomycetaceae bacterium]|nr:type II secretion system protein [Planctomycetaceae bacterium]
MLTPFIARKKEHVSTRGFTLIELLVVIAIIAIEQVNDQSCPVCHPFGT